MILYTSIFMSFEKIDKKLIEQKHTSNDVSVFFHTYVGVLRAYHKSSIEFTVVFPIILPCFDHAAWRH